MRVNQEIVNRYTVTAGGLSYPVTFPLYEDGDVSVVVSSDGGESERALTLGTDYSVAVNDDHSGGTVTLVSGIVREGDSIALSSNLPYTQELDLSAVSTIDTASTETQLDRTTQQIQQIAEKAGRAVTVPVTSDKTPDAYMSAFWQAVKNVLASIVEAGKNIGSSTYVTAKGADTPRTLAGRFSDVVNLKDFGAKGDGVTDDTRAIMNAINKNSSFILAPSLDDMEPQRYLSSGFSNLYGNRFMGRGRVMVPDGLGAYTVNQYDLDEHSPYFGLEYTYRLREVLKSNEILNIALFGDSTVIGGNGETDVYKPENYIKKAFIHLGIPNVNIMNFAVSGTTIQQSDVPDNIDGYDVVIMSYGINDAGYGMNRLSSYVARLREILSAIRAREDGSVAEKTIVIKTSNSVYDAKNSRDFYWLSQLRLPIIQACRDFKCVFFDTTNLFPDSSVLAGTMMDNPYGDGRGIHPLDNFNSLIWGNLIDFLTGGPSASFLYKTNNFINQASTYGMPDIKTSALQYGYGVSVYRATKDKGWPVDGAVKTSVSVDGAAYQEVFPYAELSKKISRTFLTGNSAWSKWTGVPYELTPMNSWISDRYSPKAVLSESGIVRIEAFLKGGDLSVGTQVLSGLPQEFVPKYDMRFSVLAEDGSVHGAFINSLGAIGIVDDDWKTEGMHIIFSYSLH